MPSQVLSFRKDTRYARTSANGFTGGPRITLPLLFLNTDLWIVRARARSRNARNFQSQSHYCRCNNNNNNNNNKLASARRRIVENHVVRASRTRASPIKLITVSCGSPRRGKFRRVERESLPGLNRVGRILADVIRNSLERVNPHAFYRGHRR